MQPAAGPAAASAAGPAPRRPAAEVARRKPRQQPGLRRKHDAGLTVSGTPCKGQRVHRTPLQWQLIPAGNGIYRCIIHGAARQLLRCGVPPHPPILSRVCRPLPAPRRPCRAPDTGCAPGERKRGVGQSLPKCAAITVDRVYVAVIPTHRRCPRIHRPATPCPTRMPRCLRFRRTLQSDPLPPCVDKAFPTHPAPLCCAGSSQ